MIYFSYILHGYLFIQTTISKNLKKKEEEVIEFWELVDVGSDDTFLYYI